MTYLLDTFTGTNGAALTAHTPDAGPAWSKQVFVSGNGGLSNGGEIQSNAARISPGLTGNDYNNVGAVVDMGYHNIIMTCQYTAASGSNGGLFFRVNSTGNYLVVRLRTAPNDDIRLAQEVSGVQTPLQTAAYSWDFTVHNLSLTVKGNLITFDLDGTNYISYTTSQFNTETKHGIGRGGSNGNDIFDNLNITTIAPVPVHYQHLQQQGIS